MEEGPRLTRRPVAPALVRRGMSALAFGVGLGGAACGGEATREPLKSPIADARADAMAGTDGATEDSAPAPVLDAAADLGTPPDAQIIPDVVVHPDGWLPPCGIPPGHH